MTKVRIFLLSMGIAVYSFMLLSPTLERMALQGFYLVIPIFVALVLFPGKSSPWDAPEQTPASSESKSTFGCHHWHVVALFLSLQLISLAVIRLDEDRSTAYYILIFASLLLVCWQAVRVTRTSQRMSFPVLVEIGLLLSNVISSKAFCYYYYFGGGDSIVHSHFVNLILATGRLQPEMGTYEFFPLTHIIAAIVKEISGIGLTLDSLYWPFVTIAFASPFAVYKIAQRMGFEHPIPLYSALIVPFGSLTIRFYADALPQGLEFFFAFMLVMCALVPSRPLVLGIPILLLISSATLTHQVTVPFAVAGVVMAGFFAARLNIRRSRDLSKQTGALFAMIYISYFALISFAFYQVIVQGFAVAPGDQSILSVINSQGPPTLSHLLVSAIRNSGLSLMIFFMAIATGLILVRGGKSSRARIGLLALLAVASVIYFPTPLSLSPTVRGSFALWRIAQFAEPLILVGVVVGVSRFAKEKSMRRMGVAAIMAIIVFTAIGSSVNDKDHPWIGGRSQELKTYFIESDMLAMDFARMKANGLTVYSDLPVLTYLQYEGVGASTLSAFGYNISVTQGSFVLFRFAEFESPGCSVIDGIYKGPFAGPITVRVADVTPLYTGSGIVFDDGRNVCAITMSTVVLSVSR
jgi:hypothetical protein